MIKTYCKAEYKKVFSSNGLRKFEDFFSYNNGSIVNKNNRREVLRFSFNGDGWEKVFFMKRFFNPHFKDMMFTWRVFGRPCSQAVCECNNAKLLLENGINTYQPVYYGEQKVFGIERKSFLVTEKLKGICLTDFISEYWRRLSSDRRRKIINLMADTAAKIHNAGINFPDLYIWHFFITPSQPDESGDYELAVIDLHRMEHNVKSRKKLFQNMGRLTHSMIEKYFDKQDKDLLIDTYLDNRKIAKKSAPAGCIRKYEKRISRRRKPKKY